MKTILATLLILFPILSYGYMDKEHKSQIKYYGYFSLDFEVVYPGSSYEVEVNGKIYTINLVVRSKQEVVDISGDFVFDFVVELPKLK
jgi:hypothetical protein